MWKPAQSLFAVAGLAVPSIASADVTNGSFETQSYAGWTVEEDAVNETFATAAIVRGDARLEMGSKLFDHADQVQTSNYSSGLPLVPHPTDGEWQALLLQNGPSTTRLSQIVEVPQRGQLTFDVAYHNWHSTFSADQAFRVTIRDVDSNAVLGTVFEAAGGLESPMSHQSISLGAFAGMTVKLQFEVAAQNTFFDVQLDNVDVRSAGSGERPDVAIAADEIEDVNATADDVGGCSTGRGGTSLLAALALVALRRRRRR